MKISIITTTFNSGATLRDTIESVLTQTYSDIEYIIKDAGSTDDTLSICREYEPKFEGRMKIISCPDKGIYDGMNQGILASSGDVVGILNSDDFFHRKDIIQFICESFARNSDIDGLYGDVTVVSAKDKNKTVRYTSAKWFKPWMFKIGLMPPHQSFYVRRECLMKYGLYKIDYKIAADFELMMRYFLVHKIKTNYIPVPVLTFRNGGASTTLKNKRQLNKEEIKAWRENGFNHPSWFVFLKYPFRLTEMFLNKKKK